LLVGIQDGFSGGIAQAGILKLAAAQRSNSFGTAVLLEERPEFCRIETRLREDEPRPVGISHRTAPGKSALQMLQTIKRAGIHSRTPAPD
jgi:hypothetical protein